MTKHYIQKYSNKTREKVLIKYLTNTVLKKDNPCANCGKDVRCKDCDIYNSGVDNYLELKRMLPSGSYPAMYDLKLKKLVIGKDRIRQRLEHVAKESLKVGTATLPSK